MSQPQPRGVRFRRYTVQAGHGEKHKRLRGSGDGRVAGAHVLNYGRPGQRGIVGRGGIDGGGLGFEGIVIAFDPVE